MNLDGLKELKMKEMEVCMSILYRYGFHGTAISSLNVEGMQAVLGFEEGVFWLDEYGRETELTGKCKLIFEFYDDPSLSFEIDRVRFGMVKEIKLSNLQKYLAKGEFRIERCSYSSLESCVIFKGQVGSDNLELVLCNVIGVTVEIEEPPVPEAENSDEQIDEKERQE